MIRTYVYVTEQQARAIRLRARREHKPQAQVIRELIEEGLNATRTKPGETTGDALLRLAAIGGTGPADLSSRIDDYLYGDRP